MEKESDFRSVTDEVRDELRSRAIKLLKRGNTQKEVADIIGCHYNTVNTWWKQYNEKGHSSLKSRQRGRKSGEFRLLNPEQESFVQKAIVDKMPDQLKLSYALWTRKAVRDFIYREFKVKMALNTIGMYLNSWGFTPQKPKKQAYEQNPKAVQKWLDEEYPSIKARAKTENAEIHWGDETGIRNDNHYGRSYAPKGKTPVRKHLAKRLSVNMISSITNQGKVRFMTYSNTMTSELLIDFFKRLIKDNAKKVFLILDNLRVHHSKKVKEWLSENRGKIEVFYLPSYSPERNPDEYLNCDLKTGLSAKVAPQNMKELKSNINSHMKIIQYNPQRIMAYFKHESINYAA